jgi:hypothetical protein
MYEDFYDFEDCDNYDEEAYDLSDEEGDDSNEFSEYGVDWDKILFSNKRFSAHECQELLFQLRYTWSSGFCYERATSYCKLVERFYETTDETYARYSRSIEYSLSALIMDGRKQVLGNKSKLKSLDKQIKNVYDLAFKKFCSYEFNLAKTPYVPSSDSLEAGLFLNKNVPLVAAN